MANAFHYKAYDAAGALVRGEVEAANLEDALALVRARGLLPFHAEARAGHVSSGLFSAGARNPKLSRRGAAMFFRELSVLLAAELRVEQALEIIAQQIADQGQREIVSGMRDRVRQGKPLSAAMRDHPHSFEPFEIALIRNSETRGDLSGASAMAADLLDRSLATRGRFVSAMIYPAILTFTAIGAILVVALVLAPTILPMYERSGAPPPPAFAALIVFSDIIKNWWWALIGVVIAAVFLLRRLLQRDDFRRRADRALLSAPFFGAVAANAESARICRTLASLVRAGAPLADALGEAANVANNLVFRDHFAEARERVRQGRSLSEALSDLPEFPASLRRFVSVGEQTGKLQEMLSHGAEHSDAAAARSVDRLMTSLSPILTLTMGVLVGSLIAIVLSAILGANDLLVG